MIRFGGPVFMGTSVGAGAGESHGARASDPVALAKAHKAKGYRAAYAPRVALAETDRIREIRQAFEAEDIMIAEVGYWENLLDTEPAEREKTRRAMVDALALAEEMGARCAVDILGSYCHGNGNSSHAAENFSDDAFDEAVEIARTTIDSVKPKSAFFAYEIFPFNVVDSPELIEKLLKAVDRRQFGVHLDLVNLINCPRAYWTSGNIMRDCIERFGARIVSAHAKDIEMRQPAISVILREVLVGAGNLDIAANLRELDKLTHEVPYLMEHLPDEKSYDLAAQHIRKVAAEEGITI